MLNQIVVVGRLVNDVEKIETENGGTKAIITLAVPRSYKNAEGIYETDFIDFILWNNIAENTLEYCRKGDLVGIKGRIQTRNEETNEETNEEKRKITELIAEKVTFLSSTKKD